MSAPERIYLQDAGDYSNAAEFEVTWCVEPQHDCDTEYVRADTVAEMIRQAVQAEREACAKAIRDSLPDASEIYRMMLASPSKKRVTYAQTIAAAIRARGDA